MVVWLIRLLLVRMSKLSAVLTTLINLTDYANKEWMIYVAHSGKLKVTIKSINQCIRIYEIKRFENCWNA